MFPDFLSQSVDKVAQKLLGCELIRILDGQTIRVRIVETESYDQTDAASHSFKGRTPRTDVMFGSSGYLYVYFTYGMHFCCNIVTGQEGVGEAVLIRAVEPLQGIEQLVKKRKKSGVEVTNGPAKLSQALGIDKTLNGHDLHVDPLQLIARPQLSSSEIIHATRIGISVEKDKLRRFYIKDNPYVSKP